jgi:hypothetical protein
MPYSVTENALALNCKKSAYTLETLFKNVQFSVTSCKRGAVTEHRHKTRVFYSFLKGKILFKNVQFSVTSCKRDVKTEHALNLQGFYPSVLCVSKLFVQNLYKKYKRGSSDFRVSVYALMICRLCKKHASIMLREQKGNKKYKCIQTCFKCGQSMMKNGLTLSCK